MQHNKTMLLPCFEANNFVQALVMCNRLCFLLLCCLFHGMVVIQHENKKMATSVRICMLKMLSLEGDYWYCILCISSVRHLVKRGE